MSVSQELDFVSIIICHYSKADDFGELRATEARPRGEMLRETIRSLYKNTDYPAELIVIDNGGRPDDSEYLLACSRAGIINTYIRNKENMNFGWAWNQGAKLASGKYLCFTCNDIGFHPNWLSNTILPLLNSKRKFIASPLVTPDKDQDKYYRGNWHKHRLNSFAGSNCMLMDRKVYEDIGEFSTHPTAGTHWHRKMSRKGYLVVLPPENKATHLAHQGGVNFHKKIPVRKTLLDKTIIDYSCQK